MKVMITTNLQKKYINLTYSVQGTGEFTQMLSFSEEFFLNLSICMYCIFYPYSLFYIFIFIEITFFSKLLFLFLIIIIHSIIEIHMLLANTFGRNITINIYTDACVNS